MALHKLSVIEADFRHVLSYTQQRHLLPEEMSEETTSLLRRIHSYVYSIAWWPCRLLGVPAQGRPFLEEMASDAIQLIPAAATGMAKSCALLNRGVIENVIRYIYYVDHVVEYQRANNERRWFITIEEHFEYMKNHPRLVNNEAATYAIGELRNYYDSQSALVHGRRIIDMQVVKGLKKIQMTNQLLGTVLRALQSIAASVHMLLWTFESERIDNVPLTERRVIKRALPKEKRLLLDMPD